MVATVVPAWYGGNASEPAGVSALTVGITFSLSDAQNPASGVAPVVKPAATGTAFSWIILLALKVTGTSASSISNRTIAEAAAFATGSAVFFADQPTYRRPATGNRPPATGADGSTPAATGTSAPVSYTKLTTVQQSWDATAVSAGSLGRNGDFVELVFAIDHSSAQGAGQETLPDKYLQYLDS